MVRILWNRKIAATAFGAVFGIAGLVVLLAGLAALTADCHDRRTIPGPQPAGSGSPSDEILRDAFTQAGSRAAMPFGSCGTMFRYAWWTAVLEFVALHGPLVELFSPRFKLGSVGLLAVAVVLLMDHANSFLVFADEAGKSTASLESTRQKAHVAFAGTLITSIANFYLICLLGWAFPGAAADCHTANGIAGSSGKASRRREAAHNGDARSHPLAIPSSQRPPASATDAGV